MRKSSPKSPLILITGATATGKTSLSIDLCNFLKSLEIEAEIINGDSLLFYRELNIGTAKPSPEEIKSAPHHLINVTSVNSPLNASDYVDRANAIIDNLHQSGKIPIITGGSAFYIRALIKGLYGGESSSADAIKEVEAIEKTQGWSAVRNKLKECDPLSYENLHENDKYRNKRALEYFLTARVPFSQLKEAKDELGPYDFSTPQNSSWNIHNIYLSVPKEEHWEIINRRAKEMIQNGLLEEVSGLLREGYSDELKPLQSIGYKETIEYLKTSDQKPSDLISLQERIFINTRRLAKSQKTFFKKIAPKMTYNPLEDREEIFSDCLDFLKCIGFK